MNPSSQDALLLFAHIHATQGSLEKAGILLAALHELDPAHAPICRLYAWVLLEQERYADALPVTEVLQQLDVEEDTAKQAQRLHALAVWGVKHAETPQNSPDTATTSTPHPHTRTES